MVAACDGAGGVPRRLAELGGRRGLCPAGSRLVLVDDGSDDDGVAVARAYRGSLPLGVLELGVNQGPGGAFRAGFAAALADHPDGALVVTLESDTTSDLDALAEMLRRAGEGADLVLASVHNGGRMLHVSAPRRLLSRGAGMVVRRALDLDAMTVSSFFRVYRAPILDRCPATFRAQLTTDARLSC